MATAEKKGQNLLLKVRDGHAISKCYTELDDCRKRIENGKPSLSKVEEAVDRVLTPSSPKDWHKIRFFQRVNDSVKEKFRKFQALYSVKLEEKGEFGSGNAAGIGWDKKLSDYIKKLKRRGRLFAPDDGNKNDKTVEFYLLQAIFKIFKIHLLEGHFPLYGYACDETDAPPQVYFWHGEADAIGWYEIDKGKGRYVIVDWKVLDILDFWEKNKDAFGKYLHQCLIYARLFRLHMQLDYLPQILIVPISSITEKDTCPALFKDYPDDCKKAIESFKWSVKLPKPTMKVRGGRPFMTEGRVKRETPLGEVLDMNASAGELLDALGLASLELEISHVSLDSLSTTSDESLLDFSNSE